MFYKVTHSMLLNLQDLGYTILKSVSSLRNDNPTFYPLKIKNVDAFLIAKDKKEEANLQAECQILVIADALKYMPNEWLVGEVFMEDHYFVKYE